MEPPIPGGTQPLCGVGAVQGMILAPPAHLRKLLVLGLALEAGFLLLVRPGLPLAARVGVQLGMFLPYVAAIREAAGRAGEGKGRRLLLAFAVLFRLTLLGADPFYSDDLYRYLWDGHLQVHAGLNPYLLEPANPTLRPFRTETSDRINHPEISTIYPPVAQLCFAAAAGLGGSVMAWKGLLILIDLTVLGLLVVMLGRAGASPGRALIYAWSPLVVAEVAGNGHVDALAILFLIFTVHLIISARPGLSTLALGLGAGAKILPLLTFPVFLRRLPRSTWPVPFLVLGAVYLPYLGAGSALFRGLREYSERWQHNDSLFRILLAVLEWIDPTAALKSGLASLQSILGDPNWFAPLYRYAYPVYLARFAALLAVIVFSLVLAGRRVEPVRGVTLILCAILLLSPTVHPWYLLWIVPFLVLRPSPAWLLLTGLVPLSYLDPGPVTPEPAGAGWIRWVEYVPFYLLLAAEMLVARRTGVPVGWWGMKPVEAPERAEQKGRAGESPP